MRGTLYKQPALAATLEQIAHAGLDDFYRGDVARELAGDLDRVGSPVTRADLERWRANVAEPLVVEIGAGTLYNTPPPTQGFVSLMMLALFDRVFGFRGRPWTQEADSITRVVAGALVAEQSHVA